MSSLNLSSLCILKDHLKINWNAYFRLARLHSPVGIFLFFWPFAWAILMNSQRFHLPVSMLLTRLVMYGVGSVFLRSAACVLNDICDIEFDRAVERTKTRPLPAGVISITGATIYLTLLTAMCIFMLGFVNPLAFIIGLFGLLVPNVIYPLAKRFTYWPQAWLGLAINWGFLVGSLDLDQSQGVEWFLFVSMLALACWTMVYDTIYGCQDKSDDIKIGIKSTALLFGSWLLPILTFFATSFVILLSYSGYLNHQGIAFYGISVAGSACHIAWQLLTLNPNDANNCSQRFKSNITLGGIVSLGLLVDFASV